ncbi:type II secretion system protein [Helicobacter cappadocius]|uniref:Type II secretion system protein n=1 Tax=Helicobacter cappadocius TaxID=3063998 RepID=A0AA90PJQ0_9HELI|nr:MULTISPECIES: type II secretion system protein [unclassified Helicobacter]MDO7252537.1 type II secretion system protein [Helicobacter sp. faydin-H75]MDP2538404.1 type II secretion system protein [Helicobacter sp. faydin-H76]
MVASNSNAFSYIELVFGIVIFGVILSLAVPRLSFNSKICNITLSTRLATVQNELSLLFTQSLFSQKKITKNEIYLVLSHLEEENTSKCSMKFDTKSNSIFAVSGEESVKFSISPKDFSTNPKISCPLVNRLCKKLSYKRKQK